MITLYAIGFLYINNTVLLVKRTNKNFGQGMYSLVGGKVEAGEPGLQAFIREVKEETNLDLNSHTITLAHTFHRKGTESELIALCFKADISKLPTPSNNEPSKHDDLRFFDINNLPSNILPAHKQAIECIQKGISYSEHGWK